MLRTPEQIKSIRSRLGLSQKEYAERYGISLRSVAQWEIDGLSEKSDFSSRAAVLKSEVDATRFDVSEARARISGALADLPADQLQELLIDVKRRQLTVLMAEFSGPDARRAKKDIDDFPGAPEKPERTRRSGA